MMVRGRFKFATLMCYGLVCGGTTFYPGPAQAHFVMLEPSCYSEQSDLGLPLKSAPCGQADPGMPIVATGAVTMLTAGSSVTVSVQEVIFHPGHYRVAIAADQSLLPADPPVTAGATPCGSTVIDPSPTLPLLADGALLHATPFSTSQSFSVRIPPDVRCDHCVLQVVEFMSDHGLNNPGGCFYYHCAVVSVVAPGGDAGVSTPGDASSSTSPDASSPAQPDGSVSASASNAGGCSCSTGDLGTASPTAGALLFFIAIGFWRKRRRE